MTDDSTSGAIREFLGEAEEIMERLNLDLIELGDRAEAGDFDPDLLNSIFRGAHSIKGLAGMVGFEDISDLSHQMESLLDRLRLGKVTLNDEVVEALFDSLENLSRLVGGKGGDPDFTFDLSPILTRIDTILTGKGGGGKASPVAGSGIPDTLLNVLTEYEEHRLNDNLQKGKSIHLVKVVFPLASFDQELAELTEQLKPKGEVLSTLPNPGGDITVGLGFSLLFATTVSARELSEYLDREDFEVETLVDASSATPEVAPESPQVATPQKPARNYDADDAGEDSATLRSISRTVRVDIEKLDLLMNIVGELVISKGAISDLCDRLKAADHLELGTDLQKATRTLERRLDELQKGVMDVRMVPVGQLFDKMNRIVRKVARENEKKIHLEIKGADTELDKLIIEELADPLMHLIRNSIDHGIESSKQRLASGKAEKGTITLRAAQKGNHVLIEIADDGQGINVEKIRKKAISKGLLAEHADPSEDELIDMIFMPGFSTAEKVSELSGRGVGMDVVKNNITALSGMIDVSTQLGKGTTIAITLPITLAIIKALIIEVCGRMYAIPINSVLETLMIERSMIRTIERREVLELRQSTLPLVRLSEIFGLPVQERRAESTFVVVVGLADKKMGIIVDELMGQQDVVIKSLGETLSFVKGFAGAADLGNQKTILVLDVGGLMGEALRGGY